MPTFAFTGAYETNVELPDSTVVLARPGTVHDLPFDEPGPLWVPAHSDDPIPAPTPAAQPEMPEVPAVEAPATDAPPTGDAPAAPATAPSSTPGAHWTPGADEPVAGTTAPTVEATP